MMITAERGYISQHERYAFDNAGKSLTKYILLKKGELAYNHGASKLRPFGSCFALNVNEARVPFVYHCFKATDHDANFISLVLNSPDATAQLRQLVSSGARMDGLLNISFQEYQTLHLLLPELAEQQGITTVMGCLDSLITLHQR